MDRLFWRASLDSKQEVCVLLQWVNDGTSKHAKVTLWIKSVTPKIFNVLNRAGWNVSTNIAGAGALVVSATMPVIRLVDDPTKAERSLEEAIGFLNEKGSF
jgi:hypothetical protein